jgi:hypothetical protein
VATKRDLHTGKHDHDEEPERSDSFKTPSGQTTPTLHGSVALVEQQEESAAMIMGKEEERSEADDGRR